MGWHQDWVDSGRKYCDLWEVKRYCCVDRHEIEMIQNSLPVSNFDTEITVLDTLKIAMSFHYEFFYTYDFPLRRWMVSYLLNF